MSYASEWAAAIARSKRFNLEVPPHELQLERRFLTDARMIEFPYVVQRCLGELDYSDVVLQCMSLHYRLVPVMEDFFGCPVLYTIGWIDDGTDKGMFKFDDRFIAEKLANGHVGTTVNLHAWLTLPSMEVMDVALATTIAIVQKLDKGHGAVLAKHADDLRGMAYKPMLVGPDFLRKSGVLFEGSVFT